MKRTKITLKLVHNNGKKSGNNLNVQLQDNGGTDLGGKPRLWTGASLTLCGRNVRGLQKFISPGAIWPLSTGVPVRTD